MITPQDKTNYFVIYDKILKRFLGDRNKKYWCVYPGDARKFYTQDFAIEVSSDYPNCVVLLLTLTITEP